MMKIICNLCFWLMQILLMLSFGGCVSSSSKSIHEQLYIAFENNNQVAMKKFIDLGANINFKPNDVLKQNMLTVAVIRNDASMVDFLLKNGATPTINEKNGRNLLSHTSKKDIGEILLKYGVSATQPDQQGNNPLHWGCARQKVNGDFVEFLLNHGTSVLDRNKNGMTPLHVICLQSEKDNKFDILNILLKHGADVNAKDNGNTIPLQYAASRDNPRTLELLIPKGANVNHQDMAGNTALHYAYALNGQKNVNFLLEHGADSTIRNNAGQLYHEITPEIPDDIWASPRQECSPEVESK